MKLTYFDFYYNTPFDLTNTMHFDSFDQRDEFFSGDVYNRTQVAPAQPFNFVRDRLTLKASISTEDCNGLNYCRFWNEFQHEWYYCFVERTEYINDRVTKLYLVCDVLMTFTQGEFTNDVGQVYVDRMSATQEEINNDRLFLMTNDDVLKMPKQYRHKDLQYWEELTVVFTSSVDLTGDFGTENDPKLKTSKGQTHDNLTSPVDIYVAEDEEHFNKFMEGLADYPWIAQNINDVALLPTDVVDINDFEEIKAKNDFVSHNLYKFKNNTHTSSVEADELKVNNFDELKAKFGLVGYPDFIFREGYTNIDLTNWQGQQIKIDPVLLNGYTMKIMCQATFGYHNEIDCFVDQYNDGGENSITGLYRGSYKDNAIIFKDFNSIPVLIDNYKLGKANTAHQRALANSNTFTGKVNRVLDSNNDIQDRFMSALSLTSSVTSLSGIAGGLTSDYDYYRKQRAEFADMAISAPTVDQQDTSNGFAIGRYHYGLTTHYSGIDASDADKVVRYHANFGFDYGNTLKYLNPISTKKVVGYYKFTGAYSIGFVPSQFNAQLKLQFENGVRMYRYNGDPYCIMDADVRKEFMA